jgi:hypothetical protein
VNPKIAVFDFANCEGFELQTTNPVEQKIDFYQVVNVTSFRESTNHQGDLYDIAFFEGSLPGPGISGFRSVGNPKGQEQVRIRPRRRYNS